MGVLGSIGSSQYKPTGTTVKIDLPTKKKTTSRAGTSNPNNVKSPVAKVGSTTAKAPTPTPVNPNPTSSYGSTAVQNAAAGGASGQGHNPSQTAAGSVGSSQYNQDVNPWSGFAGRYDPMSAQTLYDNPSIVGNDVLKNMGLGSNSALQGMFRDVAANAPLLAQIYTSLSGAGSDEATVNTMAEYMRQMGTVGGNAPDATKLIYALMHPTGALATYFNPVRSDLSQLTGEEQLKLLQPYMGAATQGLNPLFQNAIMSALNQGLLNFNTEASHGQSMEGTSFIDYLNRNHILPNVR